MSSGHLIVGPPSLKRRPNARAPEALPHLQSPALCPPLSAGKTPRGVIRPENPTARPETTSSLARTPSPVGSESSDFYYDDPVFDSTFTSPPRAANEHNAYDSDASEAASTDAHNATTPTPQPTRAMSTASIVEITMDERPATPVPDAAPAKRGKAGKKNKGKKRAAQAHAIAASLGHTTVLDHATGGTSSSSYRLPESPSKRIRTSPGGKHRSCCPPGHLDGGHTPPAPPDDPTRSPQPPRPQALHPAPLPTTPLKPSLLARPQPPLSPAVAAAPALAAAIPATLATAVAVPAPAVAAHVTPAANIAQRLANAAEAAPMGPVWLTADQNPPRGSYTPTPPGGFPEVVYSSALLTQGMPPGLMQLYSDVPDPKFFVVPSATTSTWTRRVSTSVHTPNLRERPSSVLWLVAGLPPHLAQAVLDRPALSSRPITLFTIPFSMPVIGFIGTFAIQANGDINEFVRTHRDAFGPQVSADQAWHIFSNSVAVEGMELLVNNTITVACSSVSPPPQTTTERATSALLLNHPTGLCPFPRLPGWLGPTPHTITALAEASRQAAAKAQELIRGNAAPGPSGSAHRAGGSGGRGNANTKDKKGRKDGGNGKKGGDAKGKGRRHEHDDFF
ncbi:hypothetical protein B0H14DRAFT_3482576 [Mycena olivaceomarginata]|nr:hypothetical protein B0H14DRAFT_3482576 [Mycena olivaceomarginata]